LLAQQVVRGADLHGGGIGMCQEHCLLCPAGQAVRVAGVGGELALRLIGHRAAGMIR
jgi:hypothetical protein